ncbi:MAG: tetratricopeptide repeat protein [Fluviicola sp.]|nr:tetratricopeptide repeat protein [Fluviicola sp.]
MKQLLLLIIVYFTQQTAYGQLPVFQPGLGTVVSTVSSMGRGIRQANEAKNSAREQEERDYMYWNFISLADTFYVHQQYEKAISQYQKALEYKDEQYPKDRIALAAVAQRRLNGDPYQLAVDKGDSLYALYQYQPAIDRYNEAIALKSGEQYPRDQISKINLELSLWKTVHFSGLPIAGERVDHQTSKAFSNDPWSDFIVPGNYSWVDRVLAFSNFTELDGVAIPANTRLIVYSERDFKGTLLLDITGPAIVYNSANIPADSLFSETYTTSILQETFPPEVRTQSNSDMHLWINGSMEIITVK